MHRKEKNKKAENKRGIIADYLPWIILAVVVLGVVMLSLFIMKEKGFSLIDNLKGIFKGR